MRDRAWLATAMTVDDVDVQALPLAPRNPLPYQQRVRQVPFTTVAAEPIHARVTQRQGALL